MKNDGEVFLPILLGFMFCFALWLGLNPIGSFQKQAVQYGYAHYVGTDQKWEWIKPERVK